MEFLSLKNPEMARFFPLWHEAFGDSEATVSRIFRAIAPHSTLFLCEEENVPVSMLFAVEQQVSEAKIAYIYAVATKKTHQGRGFAAKLLAYAENELQNSGISACILSPAEPSLALWYARQGYRQWSAAHTAAPQKTAETPISAEEYELLREKMLQNIPHNTPPKEVLSLYTLTPQGAWEGSRCIESLTHPRSDAAMCKAFAPDFPENGYFSFILD